MTIINIRPGNHPGSEKGSISVLIAFLIPVMCLMVVLVASIGQLIYAKIRLQITANTCALAAASVQAAGLNEIADLNYDYKMELKNLETIMKKNTTIWHDDKEALQCIDFYNDVLKNIFQYQQSANRLYGKSAMLKNLANTIKQINLPESRLEQLYVPGGGGLAVFSSTKTKKINYDYYDSHCENCMVEAYYWEKDPHARNAYGPDPDGSENHLAHRKEVESDHYKAYERLEKSSSMTYVAVELALDIEGLVLGSRVFDTAIAVNPTITARAAAKPAGGNIFECRPEYRPVLISDTL